MTEGVLRSMPLSSDCRGRSFGLAALLLATATALPARAADEAQLKRGEVLFQAADCAACHTDVKGGGAPLAGGRPLKTPFGTFYSPNITADKRNGIGAWSEAEFRRALRQGIGRDGEYLFPVFPYPAFTGMSDQDVADLYAYLQSRPAVAAANKPHDVSWPFSWRFLQVFWRWLFFSQGPLAPAAGASAEWNRGRYLAEAVVHCQECHTPRNLLGARKPSLAYSGNPDGPDGMKVPNITADAQTGIGAWKLDEIVDLLKTGQTPELDFVGSGMAEVVKGTAALSDGDRHAIAVYLKSQPAIHTEKKPQS
jgi:mono/diheme cytochrome c family protein